MSRPPDRRRQVFFLGAGVGCAAGLPNTADLLARVQELARNSVAWGVSKDLEQRLSDSFDFFYPDKGAGFRPEVVDFFSVLSAYGQIDAGRLPDGFPDRELLADLRFAIVHVLCDCLRLVTDDALRAPHPLLDRMVSRGNVVVTTNWDTLIERTALARGIPYRLRGAPVDAELLILKLHGSVDWLRRKDAKKSVAMANYADLEELLGSVRARKRKVGGSEVLRTRVTNPGASWRTIKGASKSPFMLTMSPGKADALGPLIELWEGAYRGISGSSDLGGVEGGE